MEIYFDLHNIISLVKSRNNECFEDCKNLLRDYCNFNFRFDKSHINNQPPALRSLIKQFLKSILTRKRGNNVNQSKWNVDLMISNNPYDDGFYDNLSQNQLISTYLLHDRRLDVLEEQGCLLYGSVGKEIEIIKSLMIKDCNESVKKYQARDFKDWSVIENNTSPCTDIIVVDPYFFAQPCYLYANNSYKILEHLCQHSKEKPINIVIFTNEKYDCNKIKESIQPTRIITELKEKLKNKCKPRITIVYLPYKNETDEARKEHDRFIMTNYKSFESGNSFTYFDENNNNKTTGRRFTVSSNYNKDNEDDFLKTCEDLQKIIDRQKENGILKNFKGENKSNFLKFPVIPKIDI